MALHFIRPELLWLLPAVLPLVLLAWRKQSSGGDWAKAIDSELLPHLVASEGSSGSRLRQLWWLARDSVLELTNVLAPEGELVRQQQQEIVLIFKDQYHRVWLLDKEQQEQSS